MRERSDAGIRSEAVLVLLLILSVLLIIFTRVVEGRMIRERGGRLILFIQRSVGVSLERVKDGFGSLRRLKEMRIQYESVLRTLSDYRGIEREAVELRRENQALKDQLGFSLEMELSNIPARIIGRDPSNLFSSITVDKGSLDGIRLGAAVTAFQDGFFGLMGKVESVGTRSSRIRPIADQDLYVAGRLEDSRHQGLVQGRGDENGELLMRYVHKSAGGSIGVNDLVVTSGMSSIYPPGIYVGRVSEVRSREYANSLDIVLVPIIDVSSAEYVFILGSSP